MFQTQITDHDTMKGGTTREMRMRGEDVAWRGSDVIVAQQSVILP